MKNLPVKNDFAIGVGVSCNGTGWSFQDFAGIFRVP
jgi:hypothetical protein